MPMTNIGVTHIGLTSIQMATRHAHERNARERARECHREYGITTWPLNPEDLADAVELPIETTSGFPRITYGALY